jgi:tetratricopeptide (TPR) repeat protein
MGMYLAVVGLFLIILLFFFFKYIWGPRRTDALTKLIEAGQYKRAATEAQAMIKKNERNHRAHYMLGLCYFHTKQLGQALYEFRLLTRLNRYDDVVKEEEVRNKLAEIYLGMGQLEEAQKEFLLLVKLNPSNYEIMFKIAKIFFERNFLDQAYAYFLKVVAVNAKHAEAYFYIGQILFQNKKGNEALSYFNSAIKCDPQLHKANYFLGVINKNNSNFHQAIACLDDAQKDGEYRQRARLLKGQCLFESGDFPKALVELERAAKDITEEDAIALAIRYSLAATYERLRDLPAAIEQWERIAKVKPGYNDVLEKLSAYQELRTDDKLKDFLTASVAGFEDLCRLTVKAMGFDVIKFAMDGGNHAIILASEPESKWRNTKVSNKLIHIFRDSDTISEQTVRSIQEEMKKVNANKAICISTSKFSQAARDFATARPIDIIDKTGLAEILKKA